MSHAERARTKREDALARRDQINSEKEFKKESKNTKIKGKRKKLEK